MNKFQSILLCFLFLLLSCRKIEPLLEESREQGYQFYMKKLSPYVTDESLDLFLLSPWYIYDQSNHIIWPSFRVYGLRTKNRYYKFQITNYYDEESRPGYYAVQFQELGKEAFEWKFEAEGCGNIYTNPDFKKCLKNPDKNIYTYLNLKNKKTWKMSDRMAKNDWSWDIAFNGTEVKLNAGSNGPSNARVSELYFFGEFSKNNQPDFQKIAEVSFADKGRRFFDLNFQLKDAPYALPLGLKRVINEPDWFQEVNNLHVPVNENWWVIKGGLPNTFTKLNVTKIEEKENQGVFETVFTFTLFNQTENSETFGDEESWELPPYQSDQGLVKWCLNFQKHEIVECRDGIHDVLLTMRKRRWQINVNKGAIGPLSKSDMETWRSGR